MRLHTVRERVILKKNSGGYREYRIPGILPAGDAMLFACEARAENRGDWGDIDVLVLRAGSDGEPAQVLKIGESALPADGAMRTYNNPVLIPDGDRVHLIYHKNYERAFIATSGDGGLTWGESREITSFYRAFPYAWNVCATGPGHGIRMRGGRLVAPIWLARGELGLDGLTRKHWPSVAGCLYSDDRGLTWHPGALAAPIANGNETAVAELPDGRLLFNYRNMNPERERVLGLSADGGATIHRLWSSEALPDPMCYGSMAATGHRILFANCHSKEKRVDLTVKATADAGDSWETIWSVDAKAGYADMAFANGMVHVFYERYSYEDRMVEELVWKQGEAVSQFPDSER